MSRDVPRLACLLSSQPTIEVFEVPRARECEEMVELDTAIGLVADTRQGHLPGEFPGEQVA
jgi:hypothetical protein